MAGPAEVKTLDRASTVGVAKALGIQTLPEYNPSLLKADLISGRRSDRDGTTYYEYDLAVAPASCASGSKEDLGLGFCPYDSIVLLGAAVVDGRMYGIMVECDRDEWKKGNADLKRVRSSFRVDSQLELLDKFHCQMDNTGLLGGMAPNNDTNKYDVGSRTAVVSLRRTLSRQEGQAYILIYCKSTDMIAT